MTKFFNLVFLIGIWTTAATAQIQLPNQNQNNNLNPTQNNLNQQHPRDSTIAPTPRTTTAPAKVDSPLDTMDTDNFQRYKVDGVTAVVGNYLVLESDIKKFKADLENQGENQNVTDCEIVGHLMENKLFSHAALQDSTIYRQVSDRQLEAQVEQQIGQLVQQIGSMQKLLDYYRKDSEDEMRSELFDINKENQLAQAMQQRLTEEVEVTPEEVRQYFDSIPKGERPKFSDEVEIAQITIEPEIPQSEIDKVVNQLKQIREDIVEHGASFNTKAVLYSEDNTSSNGGKMHITRKDPLDKDFKEVAFSLREGEVSEPFKSSFGYHIVMVEKILGQEREIRHIIIMPKETQETMAKAEQKTDSIRNLIEKDSLSFAVAAKRFSYDDETRADGGQLRNPETGDTRFELNNIDPRMYNEVKRVKDGQVSKTLTDQTRTGKKYYKLIKVTNFYPEHTADYSKDYIKIRELALRRKQIKAIKEWQDEEIEDTYIKVAEDYKDCAFDSTWLDKE